MQKLDAAGKVPKLVIDAHSLGLIPRSHPEVLNSISAMDRINKMEQRLLMIQELLDGVVAENISIKEKLEQVNQPRLNPVLNKNWSDIVRSAPHEPTAQNNPPPSSDNLEEAAANVAPNEGYTLPAAQLKKKRREEAKKNKVIQGKCTSNTRIKGAPEPTRDIFVYRVHPETESDILRDHITEQGIIVNNLSCVSNVEAKFKSFKLNVNISQVNQLFDESFWPVGIRVRKFYSPRPIENKPP